MKKYPPLSLALWFCLGFMAVFVTTPSPSSAQSVVLQQPVAGPLTSPYGPRTSPKAGASSNHRGQDIGVNLANFTSTGTLISCQNAGNAGNMAVVDHGCCVQEVFMHLLSCGGSGFTTDSTGNITGPHLHWEVHVKGVRVDPAFAIGKNLCDPAIQTAVINDAYSKLPASVIGGGGGSSGACTSPKPPQQPVNSVTTIPPGGINPITGQPTSPTGPPLIVTITPGGVITVLPAPGVYSPPPLLPPSVDTGFTQPATTNNPVTGCATDTWTAMVNQSVLQTRREMLMNERYIAKPDSVLAYACLGNDFNSAGQNIGPIFSENTWWANKQINIIGQTVTTAVNLGSGSLDGAIGNAAVWLAEEFIASNFYHDFLGGTAGQTSLPPQVTSGNSGTSLSPLQGIYDCSTMAQVWQLAKCQNITDPVPFPTFANLINNDPRIYPQLLKCQDSGITQNMINVAQGQNVLFDPINTHFSILDPTVSGGSTFCAPPIPTGVTVQRRGFGGILSLLNSYEDAVCPSPGCYYQNPTFGGLGTCQQ